MKLVEFQNTCLIFGYYPLTSKPNEDMFVARFGINSFVVFEKGRVWTITDSACKCRWSHVPYLQEIQAKHAAAAPAARFINEMEQGR